MLPPSPLDGIIEQATLCRFILKTVNYRVVRLKCNYRGIRAGTSSIYCFIFFCRRKFSTQNSTKDPLRVYMSAVVSKTNINGLKSNDKMCQINVKCFVSVQLFSAAAIVHIGDKLPQFATFKKAACCFDTKLKINKFQSTTITHYCQPVLPTLIFTKIPM